MIVLELTTRDGKAYLFLDNFNGLEYNEQSGELLFVGDNTARPIYLDKGTPASEVWKAVEQAFAPLYDGRAPVPAIRVFLNLTRFQSPPEF